MTYRSAGYYARDGEYVPVVVSRYVTSWKPVAAPHHSLDGREAHE